MGRGEGDTDTVSRGRWRGREKEKEKERGKQSGALPTQKKGKTSGSKHRSHLLISYLSDRNTGGKAHTQPSAVFTRLRTQRYLTLLSEL